MSSRVASFVLGIVITIVVIVVGAYVFVKSGGVYMATNARPLPLETRLAHTALHASIGNAAQKKNPLPFNDANMVVAAKKFNEHCTVCHGGPGQPSEIAKDMFPTPPQLFEKGEMMTSDPQGSEYWKITHGIRLSGMPAFAGSLSDTERWQLAMLVAHANELSPPVRAAFRRPVERPTL